MRGAYNHHCMDYSPGLPSVSLPINPELELIRIQAVYHLMEYLRMQNGQVPAQDAPAKDVVDIPAHLARYRELRQLLMGAKRDLLKLPPSNTLSQLENMMAASSPNAESPNS